MDVLVAIKRYFRGENNAEKIRRFEELNSTINESRSEVESMIKGLNAITNDVDEIKKAANDVINSGSATEDNISVVLDNIRYKDAKFSNYMQGFTADMVKVNNTLSKAEGELARLIEENPDMAGIIVDAKHDEHLSKSLEIVLGMYKSGEVDRKTVVEAYRNADSTKRTDVDFSVLLNAYLKDN